MGQDGVYQALQRTGARLEAECWLEPGLGAARWRNRFDQTRYDRPGHHTLSVYLEGGEQTERLDGPRGRGGAGKICIMPDQHQSEWLVRDEFAFFHLYFTPAHLVRIAEQACDREGRHLELEDKTFIEDPLLASLVQGPLLALDWSSPLDRLSLSHCAWMLMLQLYRCHTRAAPRLPRIRGGLAPVMVRRVCDYIEQHLGEPVTLAELAGLVQLSEYHFARMFATSVGLPPHRYLATRRLTRAVELLKGRLPLAEIALRCGFSSQAHFGNRFKAAFGQTPGQWRAQWSSCCHMQQR